MIFEKTVENNIGVKRDVYLEIEEEFNARPLEGINLAIVGVNDETLIANVNLEYKDVVELHKGLTKYICEVQQQLIS